MWLCVLAFLPFSPPPSPCYLEVENTAESSKTGHLLKRDLPKDCNKLKKEEIRLIVKSYFNSISRDKSSINHANFLRLQTYILSSLRNKKLDNQTGVDIIVDLIKIGEKAKNISPFPKEHLEQLNTFCCQIFECLEHEKSNILFSSLSQDATFYMGSILCKSPKGLEYFFPYFRDISVSANKRDICLRKTLNCFDLENIKKLYEFFNKDERLSFLQALFVSFDYHEKARSLFKELLPKDDLDVHLALCRYAYAKDQLHLVEVLFALVPKFYKEQVISTLKREGYKYNSPRPGTLGSDDIYFVQFGKAEMYFYMDLEKYETARRIVEDTNTSMKHAVCLGEFPLVTIEVSPVATIFCPPIGYNKIYDPIYADGEGTKAIEEYTQKVNKKIKDHLGLNMLATSRQMSLVVSHDAMRFHQDQLPEQYEFLNKKGNSLPRCWLGQDLALMDWDMSKGTLSGTLIQDGAKGDRFYLVQYPGEVTTNFTLDPPIYPADGSPPVYPGAKTLPFHSATAPIDFYGEVTSGSSKGKRISNVARGVVLENDVKQLRQRATPLAINRPSLKEETIDRLVYQYENGIIRTEFKSRFFSPLNLDTFMRMPPKEGVEILQTTVQNQPQVKKYFSSLLNTNLEESKLKYYRLIKRDSGFSRLDSLDLEIPEESIVVLINRSQLPETYEHYLLSQDCTAQNLPWIQMYRFPPNSILKCDYRTLMHLSLTPPEELFLRNAEVDADSVDISLLPNLFSNEIDLLVFF